MRSSNHSERDVSFDGDEVKCPFFSTVELVDNYRRELENLANSAGAEKKLVVTKEIDKAAQKKAAELYSLTSGWHVVIPSNPVGKQQLYAAISMYEAAYNLYPEGEEKALAAIRLVSLREAELGWKHQMLSTSSYSAYRANISEQISKLHGVAFEQGSVKVKYLAAVSLLMRDNGADIAKSASYARAIVIYCATVTSEQSREVLNLLKPIRHVLFDHILKNESSAVVKGIMDNPDNPLGKFIKSDYPHDVDKFENLAKEGASNERDSKRAAKVEEFKAELLSGSVQSADISLCLAEYETEKLARDTVKLFCYAIDKISTDPLLKMQREDKANKFYSSAVDDFQLLRECQDSFFGMEQLRAGIYYAKANVSAKAAYEFSPPASEAKARAAIIFAAVLEHDWRKLIIVSPVQHKELYTQAFTYGDSESKFIAATKLTDMGDMNAFYLDKIIDSLSNKENFSTLVKAIQPEGVALSERAKDAIAARITTQIAQGNLDKNILTDKTNPLVILLNKHESSPLGWIKNLLHITTARMDTLNKNHSAPEPVRNRSINQ